MSKKTIPLSVKKIWFDLMLSQKKTIEYRKCSQWIKSRLLNKDYDYVKFINGYGNDRPYFICEFLRYEISNKNYSVFFDENKVDVSKGDYLIHLGKIIKKGNIV